nr:MAG TPA: hypothetical protein [Caudoviricetes sp.]
MTLFPHLILINRFEPHVNRDSVKLRPQLSRISPATLWHKW